MEQSKNWLIHLENTIPPGAWGYRVSMYSIALEGWRRGLDVTFKNNTASGPLNRYTLGYQDRDHHFSSSRGDKVSREAINTCVSKHLTKQRLKKAKVSVPDGKGFKRDADTEEIVAYANKLGYPLVIKPSISSGGEGVVANIEDEVAFRKALEKSHSHLQKSRLIVEEMIFGEDYRIYVVDNKVIAAVSRKAANVIGNGTDSVRVLIKSKNKEREKNPALYNSPIHIDDELQEMLRVQNHTLDSVPSEGEHVVLKMKNNVSAGGDPDDVTDDLPKIVQETALQAVQAMPSMGQAGIDIMFDKEENECKVLEVNSKPSIRTHLFPMEGKARDIPKAIVDYYFPETVNQEYSNVSYYFDVQYMIDLFQKGILDEFSVPHLPEGDLESIMLTLSGLSRRLSVARWIQDRARDYNINGFAKRAKGGKLNVVAFGNVDAIKSFRDMLTEQFDHVEESVYDCPVKIGFEIEEKQQGPDKQEYEKLKKERDYYKKKYQQIKDSRSWRATQPIRSIGRLTKGKVNNKK